MPKNPLPVVLLTIFLDLVGIGILLPVIPQLLGNPESPYYLLSAGASTETGYLLLGILTASYPLAQFFATPILGQLSDRYGRRPILIISLLGTALGYMLFATAILMQNLPLLFFARILDGITGGNISVAQAAIADISTHENRARNFGLMGATFGVGFIIGPYIGGQLSDADIVSWFNASTPFWFAALLSLVNVLSIWLILPETNKNRSLSRTALHFGQSIVHIVKAFSHKTLRWLFAVGFLFQAGFAFFTTFFGVFLIQRYGFDESAIGNFFAYVGICIVITQAFITPRVAKRFKDYSILRVTFLCTGVAILCYAFPGPWTTMLFITPLFAVFNGLSQANFMAMLSRNAGVDVQGEVLGINASVSALAQAIPPVISGLIAAEASPATTIFVAGVVIIVAGLVFIATVRPSNKEHQAAIA